MHAIGKKKLPDENKFAQNGTSFNRVYATNLRHTRSTDRSRTFCHKCPHIDFAFRGLCNDFCYSNHVKKLWFHWLLDWAVWQPASWYSVIRLPDRLLPQTNDIPVPAIISMQTFSCNYPHIDFVFVNFIMTLCHSNHVKKITISLIAWYDFLKR